MRLELVGGCSSLRCYTNNPPKLLELSTNGKSPYFG
uniref:Uncharacterized protein n=1 Tax=Anguilla anguilla TaxID=7936 RepID=A0A0E9W881_ANGAN